MAVTHKKILSFLMIPAMLLSASGCSFIYRGIKAIDNGFEDKYEKVLQEKAGEYGIDPDAAEVMQGAQYFKVYVDSPNSIEKLQELVITYRRWLRFGCCELKHLEFSMSFYDKEHKGIFYGGFTDKYTGYNAEYYYDDKLIAMNFVNNIDCFTSPDYKKNKQTPEEFYKMTGINKELSNQFREWFSENYPNDKQVKPDKSEHDITFIPGDTINHRERFVIGEKDCPIEAGTYTVEFPNKRGIIHVTDAEGNFKYRIDGYYRDGHSDSLYEYAPLPAKMELAKGDVFYIINCDATLDRVSE